MDFEELMRSWFLFGTVLMIVGIVCVYKMADEEPNTTDNREANPADNSTEISE